VLCQSKFKGAQPAAGGHGTGAPSARDDHYFGQWGEYFITESQLGSPIESAAGDWTVGTGGITPPSLTPAVESTWVGVGGGVAGNSVAGLIQADESFSPCLTTGGIPYDHTSAEWVNEWPDPEWFDGSFQDPGPVYFTDQKMSSGFSGAGP
jgi:hypothetical protein